MRKTELIVSGEIICPKTKASIVGHEHTNIEAYLDQQNRTSSTITQSSAMSQVGVGDDMDLSFCVENGFYESATLYGKSMVNCIQEPSSQDVVLPYAFENGQYVTIKDTKESGALGVELKGQTLVNLARVRSATTCNMCSEKNIAIKPNTKYIALFNPTYYEAENGVNYALLLVSSVSLNDSVVVGDDAYTKSVSEGLGSEYRPQKGDRHLIFTSKANETYLHIRTGGNNGILYTDMIILEYQEGMENWDIPYFEGMTSCKMPILHTVGKNLFDGKFELGSVSLDSGQEVVFDGAVRTSYIKVKPNTTYSLSRSIDTTVGVRTYSKNKKFVKSISLSSNDATTFTTPNEAEYIRFALIYANNDITVQAQLEEGSIITTYEPYKTSILSLPEEVVLRSLPNGVCDTFNTRTGEYVQRIGKCILDGSESQWTHANISPTNVFELPMTNMKRYTGVGQIICNTLPYSYTNLEVWDTYTGVSPLSARGNIVLRNNNTDTIQDLKAWLSQNPTTICYELETPIVTKINLSSTLKSWNTTTHIYSEIPENTLYPILSHLNPSYPVILKPSTKYSIVANSYSNNHTNSAINFNLGGATASTTVGNRVTTITTPSTLSNELLTTSGRGNKLNNVMVIEGDVAGDEPYLEGICDCKSPILSNVGDNLFDWEAHHWRLNRFQWSHGNGGLGNGNALGRAGVEWVSIKTLKLKPNQTYYTNGYISFYENDGQGLCIDRRSHNGVFTVPTNAEIACVSTLINDGVKLEYMSDPKIIISEVEMEYEPYKSNILSVNRDKIELTEDMFEQGSLFYDNNTFEQAKSFANDDTGTRSIRIRTKKLIKVKPNTTYRFSYKNSCQSWFYGYDMNENPTNSKSTVVGATEQVFTTNASTHYIALVLFKTGNPTITPSNYDYKSIQIAEVDKTIVLRSLPNGVCDTLNVETGEYVQRIKQIVLDGSENWSMDTNGGGATRFYNNMCTDMGIKHGTISSNENLICDKFSHPTTNIWIDTNESIQVVLPNGLYFIFNNAQSVIQWKEYLQSNPITVQYQLAEPIVKTVDLSGYPFAYKNGHVILSSGSIEPSLTPKIEYVVQTNRTGAIQANQDRLLNHDKRLAMLEDLVLHQLIQLEYNRAKCTFLSQTRQIFEGGIQMYHTKYELLSEFIEKKLYRSLEEVFEMLDVYFMLGDITDGEYDALYEALMPSAEEIFEVEETFDHEDIEV